jgi:hypothetical protein
MAELETEISRSKTNEVIRIAFQHELLLRHRNVAVWFDVASQTLRNLTYSHLVQLLRVVGVEAKYVWIAKIQQGEGLSVAQLKSELDAAISSKKKTTVTTVLPDMHATVYKLNNELQNVLEITQYNFYDLVQLPEQTRTTYQEWAETAETTLKGLVQDVRQVSSLIESIRSSVHSERYVASPPAMPEEFARTKAPTEEHETASLMEENENENQI